MSFQAHLDTIETKNGLTPRAFLAQAHELDLDVPPVKAAAIIDWLKRDYDLARGHATAMVDVIKNDPTISEKHVSTDGTHGDLFRA